MKVELKELEYQKDFEDVNVGETFIHNDCLYLAVHSFNGEPLAVNLETNTVEDLKWDDVCIPVKTKIVLDN